ncbi:hypothetical protein MTR67_052108 [Solanum verrucosum]|uniref:Reverse transcriptase domain-containing protein n=1 Tax=Solanum verrucosum TaxID=315347 RepID=A0AAF0V8N9_SOLVR|nr:hypothetical protein MTR67_052108 [Solanum verrucosum]
MAPFFITLNYTSSLYAVAIKYELNEELGSIPHGVGWPAVIFGKLKSHSVTRRVVLAIIRLSCVKRSLLFLLIFSRFVYGFDDMVLRQYLDMFVIVFIDYILIYSRSEDKHTDHLRIVLQVLKDQQLFANFSKCEFWLRSMSFLGHTICGKGIEVDLMKMDAVKSWPRPLSPSDIRSFLSFAGYYRSFVEGFSSVASPLITLIQKKDKFIWSEEWEKSFQE